MIKSILGIAALATLPIVANAGLISYNGYTLNEDTNIVTGGGLEWLQWDVTKAKSVELALSKNTGWRLASDSEMSSLFNDFDFGVVFDDDTTTVQEARSELQAYDYDVTEEHAFLSLFGSTTSIIEPHYAYIVSQVLFGSYENGTYSLQEGFVGVETAYHTGYLETKHLVRSNTVIPFFQAGISYSNYAPVLVRTAPTEVSEPGTIGLFLAGLAGLAASRKRLTSR